MRVKSVNVGMPREVEWRRRKVLTGIFKSPVAAALPVRRLNINGDAQADLTVHGGPDKAVYAYPSEHYGPWREQLGRELTPGNFGENLTTEGLLEDAVHIGDEFRVGTARLVVTQPRLPCFKLGIRFDDPGMVKTFLQAGKPGIYFAVLEEGAVGPGDPIERLAEDKSRITVAEMFRLVLDRDPDPAALRRLLGVPSLAAVWRKTLEESIGSEARAPFTGR
jgi:MOSC domain-containing protein YiiM